MNLNIILETFIKYFFNFDDLNLRFTWISKQLSCKVTSPSLNLLKLHEHRDIDNYLQTPAFLPIKS